jgi:tripartite ATP-independent transporter DctM subunit
VGEGLMDLWPLLVFLVLLALNAPVAIAIAAGSLTFFIDQQGLPMTILTQRLMSSADSFPLLAIPMFTLAGVIMNHSGITKRLLNLAEVLVGHMAGGLAQTNVVLATLMGFESGSGNADAAMQSKMIGTEMIKRGYAPPFAAAVVAASAVITPIVPPGLGFVIYGYLASVSVGRLFMAGLVPGVMLMTALMLVIRHLSIKRGYKPVRPGMASPWEILMAIRQAAWALTVPFVVIFGLRDGFFTPTEAGAVIAIYSMLVGFFIYRELKVSMLIPIITEAALATATVMFIITAADSFGFYMTMERVASRTAEFLTTLTTNPLLMLMIINGFLLLLGMVLESVAALILMTPILAPIGAQLGIDPVHMGLLIILNLTIGAITPPVGTLMFIACGVLRVTIADFTKAVLPLLAAEVFVLFLLIVFPALCLTVPNWALGVGR